jgi:hypothetical protein
MAESSISSGDTEPESALGERRAFVRYRLATSPQVRLLAQPGFQFRRGFLRDVSVCGVCLEVNEELAVATRLVVQFPARRKGSSLSRAGRVLRLQPDGQGRWLVGCRLHLPLSPEEVTAIQECGRLTDQTA